MPDRDVYIFTKSPPEQYSYSKIKNKEIGEEIELLNEYDNAIKVSDDIVGSTNSRYIDQFFIKVRHNKLDIYYLSQSCFVSPKRTIWNSSNQIFRDFENVYGDVGGYDMIYDEFKQLCKKTWEKVYNYLCFDRSKKNKILNFNENKNTYIEYTPETKAFWLP